MAAEEARGVVGGVGDSKQSGKTPTASTTTATATGSTTSTNLLGSSSSSSLYSWRNPPLEKQQKYGLLPLGDDFTPTPQEQRLLEMYETIKAYEKRAAYLKKDAAMRKLQERNASFLLQKNTTATRKTKRKRPDKPIRTAGDEEDEEDLEDDDEDDDDDDLDVEQSEDEDDLGQTTTKKKKKQTDGEAKLEEWRREVAEAKKKSDLAAKEQEEKMIAQHLTGAAADADHDNDDVLHDDDDELAETIVTKKRKAIPQEGGPSLLANLGPTATPPHDFSSKLELDQHGPGKVLFPVNDHDENDLMAAAMLSSDDQPREGIWTPPEGASGPNEGAFLAYLDDFDMEAAAGNHSNNTLAIKFSVPADSRRFSFNIAQADQPEHDFESILFHFNPRQRERGGQVVMNDKQDGVWGQPLNIPLSRIPLLFGQESCTLQIQIHADGFDIFLEHQHCARLEHRQDLLTSEHSRLCLQFPSTDDYGNPENWKVFKVWWGYKPILALKSTPDQLTQVAGVNSFNSIHPRKLFIRGLPKIHSSADVDIRRAELERAFAKYGGSRGIVKVVVYNYKTYASVEMETDRLADLALQEMSLRYQLNRARRTKHEALQEERLAKEQQQQAAGVGGGRMAGSRRRGGGGGGGSEWD